MKLLITLLFLAIIPISFCQETEPQDMRFGKGIEESFQQDFGDLTDNQDAIYIFNNMEYFYAVVSENLALHENYHTRIKVLNSDATDMGDIKIRYIVEDNYQRISNIKATCYSLENGEVVEHKIKKKDIFRTKIDDRFSEVSFAIPSVKEGAIIEYAYTRSSIRKFRPNTWYFSRQHPVAYSQVTFNIPEWMEFSNYSAGFKQYSVNEYEGGQTNFGARYQDVPSTKYIWAKTDLEAFENEDYTANSNDFREQVQFRLNSISLPNEPVEYYNTTWQRLNKNLLDNDYAAQLKKKGEIADLVTSLTAGMKTESEIIKTLYDYVAQNIEVEEQGWVYTSQPVKKTLKDKKGLVADANILLVNMLRTAGIDSAPLLISTRSDGYINQTYPTMQSFTYPIVYVKSEDKELLLNATSSFRPYNLPRYDDYNIAGWIVKESDFGWVEGLESFAPKSTRLYKIDATLDKDGTYSGQVNVSSNNYLSVSDRANIDEDGVADWLEALYSGDKEIIVTETENSEVNDNYSGFSYSANFEIKDHAQSINDFIYFSPLLFEIDTENPFTKEERNYPVDYPYPSTRIHSINVTLPGGYRLEETPEPIVINLKDIASVRIVTKQINGGLQIQLKEDLKQTVIQPTDYKFLQQYMDKVIEEVGKQITLVKAES